MTECEESGRFGSVKHCPCCGGDLDAAPVMRRNFRRWRTACLVLLGIACLALGLSILLGPQSHFIYVSLGIIISVNTLFGLSGLWRCGQDPR